MCLENHSEDLTLDISQDTNDLKVKKKQKKNKVTSAIKYFLNILCCPRSRTSETCRFWCYPTGQTPCCIHTEQPGWVLAPCAGCHLWEGEKANMTGITSPRGEPQSAHHSQLYTHWLLPPQAGSPLLEPCLTTASWDYPHSLTLDHCLFLKRFKKKKKKGLWGGEPNSKSHKK